MEDVKEKLREQLELLAKLSKDEPDYKYIIDMSNAMVRIAETLVLMEMPNINLVSTKDFMRKFNEATDVEKNRSDQTTKVKDINGTFMVNRHGICVNRQFFTFDKFWRYYGCYVTVINGEVFSMDRPEKLGLLE